MGKQLPAPTRVPRRLDPPVRARRGFVDDEMTGRRELYRKGKLVAFVHSDWLKSDADRAMVFQQLGPKWSRPFGHYRKRPNKGVTGVTTNGRNVP